ncbi:MAG: adenosylcobinamide-GDP ribazoletransferase [Proteobacteria bacterium]|nr:adenosylcobinamide-GDP ribazoletransferase [Pseudomonadota bacterium]
MTALRSLLLAVGFLTGVPVRVARVSDQELARSMAFFPLIGAGLGGSAYALAWLLQGRLWPALIGALLVTTLAVLTRGLHLDGVADTFDGLGAARGEPARALEVMRDPHIGAHGATALVLVLSLKVLAVCELAHAQRLTALVAAPALARWCIVPLAMAFPYARADGLGKPFQQYVGWLELAVATAACGLMLYLAGSPALLLPVAIAATLAAGFATFAARRLRGLTGDVYGAVIELAETAFLLAACVRAF